MTYRESPPSPYLQGLVAAYWGVDSAADGGLSTRSILPDGCADLICDFSGGQPQMHWVGTMTHAIQVQVGGRQDLFGIRFAPGGLFPLLGAPLSLLTDDRVAFAALPASLWRPPLDGWHADPDFAARCSRADASLLAVLPRLQPGGIASLLQRLPLQSALPASPAALADDMGVGLRTLQRRFLDHLGVSPRQHLRYLRFERARQLLLQHNHRFADVAVIAGYSDQAHFVREFRRFSGVTPGRWR
jgi:AraC-like DNA-binding protein